MRKIELIPGIVQLETNAKTDTIPYFFLGDSFKEGIFKSKKTKYTVRLNIINDFKKLYKNNKRWVRFSSSYLVQKNLVYYSKNFSKIKLELFFKENGRGLFYINKNYFSLVKFHMDNLYPIGSHIGDYLLIKFLQNNQVIIHGASYVNFDSNATLLIAPPDTGKTMTMIELLNRGFKYLGEDLTFYDSNTDNVFCMPFTSTWGHRKKNIPFLFKIPLLGLYFERGKKNVIELYGPNAISHNTRLERIILLEKGEQRRVKRVSNSQKEEIIRKVLIIQRNEFHYYKNPLFLAYDYFNKIGLDKLQQKEEEIISNLIKEKEVFIIKGKTPFDYYKEILKHKL